MQKKPQKTKNKKKEIALSLLPVAVEMEGRQLEGLPDGEGYSETGL
jgi:hypothetical protein